MKNAFHSYSTSSRTRSSLIPEMQAGLRPKRTATQTQPSTLTQTRPSSAAAGELPASANLREIAQDLLYATEVRRRGKASATHNPKQAPQSSPSTGPQIAPLVSLQRIQQALTSQRAGALRSKTLRHSSRRNALRRPPSQTRPSSAAAGELTASTIAREIARDLPYATEVRRRGKASAPHNPKQAPLTSPSTGPPIAPLVSLPRIQQAQTSQRAGALRSKTLRHCSRRNALRKPPSQTKPSSAAAGELTASTIAQDLSSS